MLQEQEKANQMHVKIKAESEQEQFEVYCLLLEEQVKLLFPEELGRKYLVGRLAGRGASATFKEAFSREDHTRMAVRLIEKESSSGYSNIKNLMREVEVLKVFDCPNHIIIVMEYTAGSKRFAQGVADSEAGALQERHAKKQFFQIGEMDAINDIDMLNVLNKEKAPKEQEENDKAVFNPKEEKLQLDHKGNIDVIKLLENAKAEIGEGNKEERKDMMELKEKKPCVFGENKIEAKHKVIDYNGKCDYNAKINAIKQLEEAELGEADTEELKDGLDIFRPPYSNLDFPWTCDSLQSTSRQSMK